MLCVEPAVPMLTSMNTVPHSVDGLQGLTASKRYGEPDQTTSRIPSDIACSLCRHG